MDLSLLNLNRAIQPIISNIGYGNLKTPYVWISILSSKALFNFLEEECEVELDVREGIDFSLEITEEHISFQCRLDKRAKVLCFSLDDYREAIKEFVEDIYEENLDDLLRKAKDKSDQTFKEDQVKSYESRSE